METSEINAILNPIQVKYIYYPFVRTLGYIVTLLLLSALIPDIRGSSLEMLFYDINMRLKRLRAFAFKNKNTQNPDISVILLDDESIEYDNKFDKNFSREYLAEILNLVAAKNPRLICLDFLLDSHSTLEDGDKELISSFKNATTKGIDIVLASRLVTTSHKGTVEVKPIKKYREIYPEKIHFGYANIKLSSKSNVLRCIQPEVHIDDKPVYSLASKINYILKNKKNTKSSKEVKLINFSTPEKYVYKSYSAKDLYSDNIDINNQIVLIGSSNSYSTDNFHTPMTSGYFFLKSGIPPSGTEIHAYILHSLKTNTLIPYFNNSLFYLLGIVIVFSASIMLTDKNDLRYLIITQLSAFITLNILFWLAKTSFPIVRPTSIALITIIVCMLIK